MPILLLLSLSYTFGAQHFLFIIVIASLPGFLWGCSQQIRQLYKWSITQNTHFHLDTSYLIHAVALGIAFALKLQALKQAQTLLPVTIALLAFQQLFSLYFTSQILFREHSSTVQLSSLLSLLAIALSFIFTEDSKMPWTAVLIGLSQFIE